MMRWPERDSATSRIIHESSGNESLVNLLPECGLSISYDHVRRLSTYLINSVITLWEHIVEIVPGHAIREKLVTRVIDNIDYDPSSTTAAPDFVLHGTSISKLQHFTYDQDNTPKGSCQVKKINMKKMETRKQHKTQTKHNIAKKKIKIRVGASSTHPLSGFSRIFGIFLT